MFVSGASSESRRCLHTKTTLVDDDNGVYTQKHRLLMTTLVAWWETRRYRQSRLPRKTLSVWTGDQSGRKIYDTKNACVSVTVCVCCTIVGDFSKSLLPPFLDRACFDVLVSLAISPHLHLSLN